MIRLKIFYFTGTGNSLAVAKKFKGELISIPHVLKENILEYKDEAIGIIFPLYCLNPPKMVREFLSRAKFQTDYLFAIATYGNLAGASMQELQKAVKRYGYQFDYMNALLMVDNFLPNFDIDVEISLLPKKQIQEKLGQIVIDVFNRKRRFPKVTQKDIELSAMCVSLMEQQDQGGTAKAFMVNDSCTRCGICTKICPADNISLIQQVTFHNKCESCYACIHACPQNAIHLKNEKSSMRWRNPEVTLEELIQSNQ